MVRLFPGYRFGLAMAAVLLAGETSAQEPASPAAVAPAAPAAPAEPNARKLAPGVLTVIPADSEAAEAATGPRPLVEIVTGMKELDYTPNFDAKSSTVYERAKNVTYHRDIWCLEFSFKPLRMLEVDIPQTTGKMQRKQITYLVYRLRNLGKEQKPVTYQDDEGVTRRKVEIGPGVERRFFPHIVLQSHDYQKAYLDRIIPAAQEEIERRERPGAKLHNSVEISRVPIPLSDERVDRGVWGVAMWEDLDPRIDFFSLYIRGLTNAFQYVDTPGAFKPGDPPGTGRAFTFKTLQLNFWRPGDSLFLHEGEFRFGAPSVTDPEMQKTLNETYGLPQRVDHLWVYR